MTKPTLFILAAGMGSRYGGLKQLDGVGPHGETIMDYSIYDAIQAGFGKVVFVIRHDFEQEFRDKVLSKYEGHIAIDVVFQSIDALPEGYKCPQEREKPWGTNHAILMGKKVINEPFAVINADDFYSRDAFMVIAEELKRPRTAKGDYCMVGFRVGNTITENGTVSRGVCSAKDGYLVSVTERGSIRANEKGEIVYPDADGHEHNLEPSTSVSMNFWGFTPDYFEFSEREFVKFLDNRLNEPKSEFFIPTVVDLLIKSGDAKVKLLDTHAKWFGVTYVEDRPGVVAKLAELHSQGIYPDKMF